MRLRAPRRLLAVTTVVAAVLGTLSLAAPADAATPPYGPDVSRWQHPNGIGIDWGAVRHGGSTLAFIKATDGDSYVNPYWGTDYRGARAAHLNVGGYHYARPALPVSTAVTQAKHLVATLGDVKQAGVLPPVLDLESSGGLTPRDLITWTQTFLETVRSVSGRTPILYTYPYFWSSAMNASNAFGRYPLWLAAYRATAPAAPAGWSGWTLWQYTSTGTLPGISGNVDINHFAGTPTQLAALANGTVATSWPVRVPAPPVAVTAAPGLLSATVTWQPSDDGGRLPSSYVVTASPGGASVTVAGTQTSARVAGLAPGVGYRFTVKAANTAGTSAASAASPTVVPISVPTAPTGVKAVAGNARVALSWAASSGGPTGYLLYRCSPAPCTPTTLRASFGASTLSFTDSSLTNGTGYQYVVRARNSYGTSGASASVKAVPFGPPTAPTALTATPGAGSVALAWGVPASTGGAAVTAYAVAVDGTTVATLPATARSFTASGLSLSPHTLTVRAVNTYGTGAAATVLAGPTGVVAAPTSVALAVPSGVLSGQGVRVQVTATLSGIGTAVPGHVVTLSYVPRKGAAPVPVQATTDAAGRAAVTLPAVVNGTVKAVLVKSAVAQAASAGAPVVVKPALSAGLSTTSTRRGRTVTLFGSTSALLAGETVYRQQWYSSAWHTLAVATVDRYGKYRFAVTPKATGTHYYRVWSGATALHTGNGTRTVALRVT